MSVAGEGLIARLRSAWFGLLGMGTAAALALVALVLNQGFPGIAELPFPSAPAELGVSQNERVVPGAPRSASQPGETRASSSSPGGEAGWTPSRTPAEAKVAESRTIAAAPAPEPVQIEQPPPPSTGDEGSAPQPQPPPAAPTSPFPASPPTAASVSAPKGKGWGWSGAPGQQAKTKDWPVKMNDSAPKAKVPPSPPAIPKAVPPPKPRDVAEIEKHPGKSDKGR